MKNDNLSGSPRIFRALLKKELTEQFRNSHLLIGAAVFAFFGILSPVTAQYLPQLIGLIGDDQNIQIILPTPTAADAYMQYIKNISQIGIMAVIFLTMGGVSKEKELGTLAFLLVKPVSRGVYLFTKAAAHAVTLLAAFLVGFILMGVYTRIFFGPFNFSTFAIGNLFLLVYLETILLLTLSLSAMVKRPIGSGMLALIIWILISLMNNIPKIGAFLFTRLGAGALIIFTGGSADWKPLLGAALLAAAFFTAGYRTFRTWEP